MRWKNLELFLEIRDMTDRVKNYFFKFVICRSRQKLFLEIRDMIDPAEVPQK